MFYDLESWGGHFYMVFIDEPTTGLDAGAAIKVGLVLRVVANLQVPVLCALLQPGNELLHLFDKGR